VEASQEEIQEEIPYGDEENLKNTYIKSGMTDVMLENYSQLYDIFFKIIKDKESRVGGSIMCESHSISPERHTSS
jgi:hypothetical protein